MNFDKIDQLKAKLDGFRPLPSETVRTLREDLILRWTFHSNAIEGNTLSLYETKVVLEDGITIGGKSLREHLEAINHREAIYYVEELVRGEVVLTESTIKNIHHIILSNIDRANAGSYRKQNVLISGASHTPPDILHIASEMQKLIEWYDSADLHPVVKATLLHAKFVNVHPFIDGNGRTSRLLLNFELMKHGYPPIIIKTEERFRYYEVLDLGATTGNYEPFVQMVHDYCEEQLRFVLGLVGGGV